MIKTRPIKEVSRIGKHCILMLGMVFGVISIGQAQWTDSGSDLTTSDDVGIGTSNPGANLHLVQDGNIVYLRGHSYRSSSGGFGIIGYGARGSSTSPAPLSSNDNAIWIRGMGYDGTDYHRVAHIGFKAKSVSSGSVPGQYHV